MPAMDQETGYAETDSFLEDLPLKEIRNGHEFDNEAIPPAPSLSSPSPQQPTSPPPPLNNFEDVITAMGPPGRYQIVRCVLLSLNVLTAVFIYMNFVFIGLEPSFACSPVNDSSMDHKLHPHSANNSTNTPQRPTEYLTSYKDCHILVTDNSSDTQDVGTFGCSNGYTYSGGKHVSIITEWDLVCDERGKAEMTQTFMSFGWFLGLFVASTLSDKLGRKKTIVITAFFSPLTELCCAFAPNVYVMIVLRFFSGFFGSGINSVLFVICGEMLVSKYRATFGVCVGYLWSCCSMLLCLIAYLFRDNSWRDLQLCAGICCMFPLLLLYFVDESPSWLYSKGEHKKASRIVEKICRENGVDFEIVRPVWNRLLSQAEETKLYTKEKDAKNYNVLDLFKKGTLRTSLLIVWFASVTNDLTYFGMFLSASTLAGNLYLNTTLMALLEIPGGACMMFMLKYRGRRFVIVFFLAMVALCLLVSTALSSLDTSHTLHIVNTSTAFYLLGKLAISNSYSIMYIYILELFPTTIRTSAIGIALSGGCLGGMLSPYLVPLHSLVSWAPGTCLIGALTISIVLLLRLPETKGKQLMSTIEMKD